MKNINLDNYNKSCITINTDASFCPVTKASGYAYWIVSDSFVIKEAGFFKTKTDNSTHAEIKCIGNAIYTLLKRKKLPKVKWLIINTDSKQEISSIELAKNNHSKTTQELHLKLINRIESQINHFRHVKAHSKIQDKRTFVNDWCDIEAKKYMKIQRKNILNSKL